MAHSKRIVNITWSRVLKNSTTILMLASILLLTLGNIHNNSQHPPAATGVIQSLRVGHKRLFQEVASEVSRDVPGGEQDGHLACHILPEDLGLVGHIPVNLTAPTWQELEAMYPDLDPGGTWRPRQCISRSRVAIVVPYRDRDDNLRSFLQHMHAFLQKQRLQYGIIVAEQAGNTSFNRGIMRNIGFREANLYDEYDCTTFNDVDLLPENDMNSYGCPDMPRHMCIALDYFDYKPIASGAIFGGIVSFRNDHFWRVNGYSNLYFGWGGEDDDLMSRCRTTGVGFYRARPQYGRYKGTPHRKDHRVSFTYKLWRWREGRSDVDGLNSLNYKVLATEKRSLYTWILAEVDEQKYKKEADEYLLQMDIKAKNSTKKPVHKDNVKLSTDKTRTSNIQSSKIKLLEKQSRQRHIDDMRQKAAKRPST